MSHFQLPPASSAAYAAMGDVSSVVDALSPANRARIPTVADARRSARGAIAGGARGVFSLAACAASDSYILAYFGPRGGWRRVWTFAKGVGGV